MRARTCSAVDWSSAAAGSALPQTASLPGTVATSRRQNARLRRCHLVGALVESHSSVEARYAHARKKRPSRRRNTCSAREETGKCAATAKTEKISTEAAARFARSRKL